MSKFDANRNLTSSLKIESFFSRMEPVEIQLEFLNKNFLGLPRTKIKTKKGERGYPLLRVFPQRKYFEQRVLSSKNSPNKKTSNSKLQK